VVGQGRRRLKKLALAAPPWDRLCFRPSGEWEFIEGQLAAVVKNCWRYMLTAPSAAGGRDQGDCRGVGVSIVARIGPIKRFGNAEQLIAYAGWRRGFGNRIKRGGMGVWAAAAPTGICVIIVLRQRCGAARAAFTKQRMNEWRNVVARRSAAWS